MNLPHLSRRQQLLAGGGAFGLVALLALHARRKAGGTTNANADASPPSTYQTAPATGGTFDSTANDVYGALEQPLFNLAQTQAQLETQLQTINDKLDAPPTTGGTVGHAPGGAVPKPGRPKPIPVKPTAPVKKKPAPRPPVKKAPVKRKPAPKPVTFNRPHPHPHPRPMPPRPSAGHGGYLRNV